MKKFAAAGRIAAVVAVVVMTAFIFCGDGSKKEKSQAADVGADIETTAAMTDGAASATTSAAAGGGEQIPAELEALISDLKNRSVAYALGIGESTDEMIARNVAAHNARTKIAETAGHGEQIADLKNFGVVKTVTMQNDAGVFKVYALVADRSGAGVERAH